jgi:hypothetical protein
MPDRDLSAEQLSAFRAHVQAAHDEVESGVILGPAWQAHAAYTGNPATVLELLDELEQFRSGARMNVYVAEELMTRHRRTAELEQQAADQTLMDPKQFGAMVAALDTADAAPGLAAVVAKRAPVGYITAYRTPEGEWLVEFDGAPWPTPKAAREDLLDAIDHCLPGLTCRTLTIYDEEIWDV